MTSFDPRMKVKKLRNGPVVAHTRDLMAVFRPGRHDNIMTACRKAMQDHKELRDKDFIPGKYLTGNNQAQDCFQVTRAGAVAMFKHLHGKHDDRVRYLAAYDRCEARNSGHSREEPDDLDPAIIPDDGQALEAVAPEQVAAELAPLSGGPVNPFVFDDADNQFTVRVMDRDGDPWFVAADVCRALDIGDTSMAVSRLDEDERGTSTIGTLGGPQGMAIVSEPGLYSLILTSRKPGARRFKRWVIHDVLPQIRKTGAYKPRAVPVGERRFGTAEELLNDHEATAMLISGYANQIIELKGQVSVLAPKAAALDYLGNCKGSLNLRNAAKALKMSPGWFNNRLQQMEILHVSDGRLVAYQKYVDQGWFVHKPVAVTHSDGGREIISQPRVTGRGLVKLAVKLGVGVHAVLGQGVLDLDGGPDGGGSLH
jgi:anti-repressor protein